jgi:hypothetical protein
MMTSIETGSVNNRSGRECLACIVLGIRLEMMGEYPPFLFLSTLLSPSFGVEE